MSSSSRKIEGSAPEPPPAEGVQGLPAGGLEAFRGAPPAPDVKPYPNGGNLMCDKAVFASESGPPTVPTRRVRPRPDGRLPSPWRVNSVRLSLVGLLTEHSGVADCFIKAASP